MPQHWTPADAPGLSGKVAIVTGTTGGLGFETALGLTRQGATTILAARDPAKAAIAIARIRQSVPGADVRYDHIDLASLASVKDFVARQTSKIDVLVNNGAVMALPTRQQTEDGFERQIGVNYLAHFALTVRLLPAFNPNARIVNVASLAHRRATLNLQDLQSQTGYSPMRAYGQSKLAMLMFTLELQRRARQQGWPLTSIAAHPGWARTNIIPNGIGAGAPGLKARIIETIFNAAAQSAHDGALPILFAAFAPQAQPGAYYGPANWGETRGPVAPSKIFPQAADTVAAARLWDLSEALTTTSAAKSPIATATPQPPAAEAGKTPVT